MQSTGGLIQPAADEEVDLGPFAAADPIALEQLDRLGPGKFFQFVAEAVGVGRDAEHPLAQRNAHDGMAAAIALTINDFFVGEHRP